ncbi:insulinase family protein [Fonticella tunisiensis]|uniref:Peptidase M16C associated domain-containing protein n=1 Tax=Fonticella tunisiensis TaxID=1096341 RepID=A0A4R7KT78_9CLOT|nr:insulinase family protein [Fonticella tunisiensis]TDT63287.1 hypothetical protein EDD71_10246 [Fonticella tunisiensis]
MYFEVGKTYHGFKLIEQKEVKELNSTARLFVHEKSGARLFSLQNDDDNKVFSISFRTPPENSTGVPHIMEHSVLCGSRKFPVKEPFVELAKGSLNTYLNAMTFSDKTMYPVASKNDKDFLNLMDVYLDAVFYPNIYKYPEILMQEGWHYELENRDDELTYKGVVYNEMKGAFSSPEGVLMRKVQESLFPDTTYRYESGGDPDVIPELTYEEFIDFHKKYYHPSNSYIYLYGNGNIDELLKFIDGEYLKNFDKTLVDSRIEVQKPFSQMREMAVEYPIAPSEREEDRTFLSLNFAVGRSTDPEIYLAFDILEHLLLETPAAPLKKALNEAEIGKDVFGSFDSSILQPVFTVVVKNSSEEKKDKFKEVVFDTLKKLVKEGIDKKLIEASINAKEFILREAEFQGYPKGLLYNIKCMDSWLHDEDPTLHLTYESTLNKIKKALITNYFEELIEKYILNNNHSSLLIVKPRKGLAEEKAEELRKKLADYKGSLSEEEIKNIIENTRKLRERQEAEDSPEDLEKIPLLSLKDINPKADVLPFEEREEGGIKVLFHPIFTNNIAYIDLYFDTRTVQQDMIPYITLLAGVLGKVSTERYELQDLSNEINIHTGGIRFSAEAYSKNESDEIYYPKFIVKSKALVDKLPKLLDLVGEIVGHTRFDDKRRIKEIVQEMRSRIEMTIFDHGHVVVQNRVASYFSPVGKYVEVLSGLSFYKFLSDLEKNFDARFEEIRDNLIKVSKAIFNKKHLIVSVTTDGEDYKAFKKSFKNLYDHLGNEELELNEYDLELEKLNEGLMTSAKVQYVAKAYSFLKLGYKYTGSLLVLKTILSLDYLWNKVRVQGGAYGGFARVDRSGNISFGSYRDPNLKETLSTYDNVYKYLLNFDASEREMTKYIIGTFSGIDYPLTPAMKGQRSTINYIRQLTQEDIQREREEVLNTKKEDIKGFAKLVKDAMEQGYICVLGNEDKIKLNKDLFNNLVTVFE